MFGYKQYIVCLIFLFQIGGFLLVKFHNVWHQKKQLHLVQKIYFGRKSLKLTIFLRGKKKLKSPYLDHNEVLQKNLHLGKHVVYQMFFKMYVKHYGD